ncbi:MAG TPA: response regulator transcription factor [Nocardioidaceae bacterium]|nr:response regulator transcription factor [Nocardioidaceae bacterium]
MDRALTRWCESQPDLVPFTGQCSVHRAQIMRAQGAFAQALEELDLARQRYVADGLGPATGLAFYERGEVLRTRGDFAEAASAYDEASAFGHEPQPGLALMWLAQGRTTAAVAAIRRLQDETSGAVQRCRVLPATVQVLLADGHIDEADRAANELTDIATDFGCEGLQATAAYIAGTVALAQGDPSSALPDLRRAWKDWINLGCRYDAALARVQIGLAFRAMGDEDSALAEFAVSERTFAELGASPAKRWTRGLQFRSLPDHLTAREVEVLRLVASGQSNPQVAAALFLSEKTVARHLSNIFSKINVSSRTASAAYAFSHELV